MPCLPMKSINLLNDSSLLEMVIEQKVRPRNHEMSVRPASMSEYENTPSRLDPMKACRIWFFSVSSKAKA